MVFMLSFFFAQQVQGQTGAIHFSDDLVKALCVEAWDTDNDGELSYQEAASVSDLGLVFKGTSIKSFDELQYFSSLQSISNDAFRACSKLQSIILPSSVVQLGDYVFYGCFELTSVTLNEGLQKIGVGSFLGCKLLTAINLPATVNELGKNVFYMCEALQTVNIPDAVTALPTGLFSGCLSLRQITIPNSVVSMSVNTFKGCSSLTEVTMPAVLPASYLPLSVSLLHLMYQATAEYEVFSSPNRLDFGEMDDLTAYAVSGYSVQNLELQEVIQSPASAGLLLHAQPGKLYEILLGTAGDTAPGQNEAHLAPRAWNGDVVTDSLSKAANGQPGLYVGANFLMGNETGLTLPTQQDKKQNYVFGNKNGHFVFSAVSPTADIEAHSAYLQIPYVDAVGIADMLLPFDTLEVENNIFFADAEAKRLCVEAWDTNGDGELSFSEAAAVQNFGSRFKNNTTVKQFNELKYFTSLLHIPKDAFYGCSALKTVMLPPSILTLAENAFYGCYNMTSLEFNDSLRYIGASAFTSCTSLKEVVLPPMVQKIGSKAFYYCVGLTSITIPDKVIEVGSKCFAYCTSLPSIKLPNSLSSLEDNVFTNCDNLTDVTMSAAIDVAVLPASVQNIGLTVKLNTNVATYCSPNALDFSHNDSIKAYSANTISGNLIYLNQKLETPAKSGMVLRGTAGNEYVLGLGTGSETDSGNLLVGTLEPITLLPDSTSDYTDLTLRVVGINVSFVPVSDSVNLKRSTAYLRLSNEQMASYTAFRANFINNDYIHFADPVVENLCVAKWDTNSDGVLSYEEAAAVTDLGDTFKGDTRIYSFLELVFFTSLTQISDSAFYRCSNMAQLILPEKLTSIGNYAFAYCYGLSDIELPKSVTSIGNGAFAACTKFTTMTLPDNISTLGDYVFDYCTNLTSIHLPEQLTAIPAYMFRYCKNLQSLYIPANVQTVGEGAFFSCSGLTKIKKHVLLPDTNIPNVDDLQYYYTLSDEWETFSAPNPIDFSQAQHLTAYAVGDYSDGVTYLTRIENAPDSTGLLLHGTPDEEIILRKGDASVSVDNLLVAALTPTEIWPRRADKSHYVFSATNEGIGFVPLTDDFTTTAHSAYLAVPTSAVDYFDILQILVDDIIVFADQDVKHLCVRNWDTNGDGELSKDEAAAVADFSGFTSKRDIRTFDEFIYFTGVTEIKSSAFQNCTSLKRITLPAGVEEIGANAFAACTSLEKIVLPSSVSSLGVNAFNGCTSLQSVNIPDGVSEIGVSTFAFCSALQSIEIPCSVASLDASAFSGCSSLAVVTMPAVLSATFPATVETFYYTHRLTEEYETFCSPYNLALPEDCELQVFTAPSCDGQHVGMGLVDSVPAGTGVLLHGEVGRTYMLNQGEEGTTVGPNLYVGVLHYTSIPPMMGNKAVFCLKYGYAGYGFYRIAQLTELDACHAYLPLDISLVGDNELLEFDSLPDIDDPVIRGRRYAVSGASAEDLVPASADMWFSLTGVRLESRPTQPGIYLHNGRKVAVK